MTVILINSILYWITAIIIYKKNGVTLYSFLWFYYALFSAFGVLLMKDELYFQISGVGSQTPITFTPYVLLYLSFLLLTYPLKRFKLSSIDINSRLLHSRTIWKYMRVANTFAIIYVIIKLFQIYLVSQQGFGIVHDMEDSSDVIYPGVIGFVMRPFNLIGRINNIAIMPMVVLLVLFGYVNGQVKLKTMLAYITPYSLGTVLMGFVGGSRAAMFFGILEVLFFYVLFHHYIPRKVKRRILFFSAIFSISLVYVTLNITRERFGDAASFTVESSILDYLGQMFPNVNYRIWENECTRPMGKWLFPFLFGGMGLDNDYFAINYHTFPWIFHTMWGGIYEEFGLIISISIVLLISFLMNSFMKRKHFRIEDIAICLFCYYIGYTALFDFHIHFIQYISLLIIVIVRFFIKRTLWK